MFGPGAGHPEKVLCVPIDYAKLTHVGLCYDGTGRVLKSAFPIKNTPEGVEFTLSIVDKMCRKRHVFFGGEDCGTFSLNFAYTLRERGFPVIGVNAGDAKKPWENVQASTDEQDLVGSISVVARQAGKLGRYGRCVP